MGKTGRRGYIVPILPSTILKKPLLQIYLGPSILLSYSLRNTARIRLCVILKPGKANMEGQRKTGRNKTASTSVTSLSDPLVRRRRAGRVTKADLTKAFLTAPESRVLLLSKFSTPLIWSCSKGLRSWTQNQAGCGFISWSWVVMAKSVDNEETVYFDITLGRKTCIESQNQNIYFVLLYMILLEHSYYNNTALWELTI